ncbi:MAG: hypothetical protein AAB400_00540 [Patescibacteria group bacterium]
MYLFLDTSTPERIQFFFATEKKILSKKILTQKRPLRIDVLFQLSKTLKRFRKTPRAVLGIAVVVGPGYFSHLRTGIAIANTWSFVFGTPLIGIPTDQFLGDLIFVQKTISSLKRQKRGVLLIPQYGREPTITKKS